MGPKVAKKRPTGANKGQELLEEAQQEHNRPTEVDSSRQVPMGANRGQ